MSQKPIKRHESIQPFSREHHHSLLLCWKIRQGLAKDIDLNRIKKFVDWSWETRIKPHFIAEEQYMFPVLSENDPLIIQAKKEHKRIESLFNEKENLLESFKAIEKELDEHIRFEERVLFNKIQEAANSEQLKEIEKHHEELNSDEWSDEFWL